jgi:hypothetical protein
MTNEHDVTLETDHLEEVIETPPPEKPVVVIQYRTRGVPWFLFVPLLLLVPLSAVAIYHRVTSRARAAIVPTPAQPQVTVKPEQTSASKDLKAVKPGTHGAAPLSPLAGGLAGETLLPLALNSQPIAPGSLPIWPSPAAKSEPAGPTASAAPKPADPSAASVPPPASNTAKPPDPAAAPKAAPSRTQPEPRSAVAVGFSLPRAGADDDNPFSELDIARNRPGDLLGQPSDPSSAGPSTAASAPDDRPQPTKEELMDDIQAEAAEKRSELKQLRHLKDHARDEIEAESLARTEEDRAAFRRELLDILKSGSKKVGQEINDLCDKYGRNYDPELRNRVFRSLGKAKGRTTRDAKVKMLRQFGVPEPGILDYLANAMNFTMNSRTGPRNVDEVRVSAARQLLQIKLTGDPGSAGGPQTQGGRAAGAGGPGSAPGPAQGR